MTKTFEQKVIRDRIVDTKTYRYRVHEYADHFDIERIALNKLDTTETINGWEVLKTIK